MVKVKSALITEKIDDAIMDRFNVLGLKVDLKPDEPLTDIAAKSKTYDIIVVKSGFVANSQFFIGSGQLKALIICGGGTENIDIDEATAKNVLIISLPNHHILSVVEYLCAGLLLLARPIVHSCVKLKTGIWDREMAGGVEIKGRTIGLLGHSQICLKIAKRMAAFSVRILISKCNQLASNSLDVATQENSFAQHVTLDEIFVQSDFLCIYLAVETAPADRAGCLLTQEILSRCKKGVRLICCSSLAGLSELEMIEALNSGQVAALFVDMDEQTAAKSRKLIEHPKVICTASMAESTIEGQIRLVDSLIQQMYAIIQGKPVSECLNPQILKKAKKNLQ